MQRLTGMITGITMQAVKRVIPCSRRRRIIYNDDGAAARRFGDPQAFLAARFDWCRDTHVESLFWCVGKGDAAHNRSLWVQQLGDANAIMLNAARQAGIEIFASLRMNDTHDAFTGDRSFMYPLKLRRPDLLVTEGITDPMQFRDIKPYPQGSLQWYGWSALDYAREEVRAHRLEFVRQTFAQYDWDGLELDFCRHVTYFKQGEAEQHLDTMTAFVGSVRAVLDEAAERRGRECLLAVRVPDSVEHCRRIGLDIESWLARGNVDVLIAGAGYRPYAGHLRELVALAQRFAVQVYPAIDAAIVSPQHTGDVLAAERLRGMSACLWALDADGIYLFNLFVPVDEKILASCKAVPASQAYRVLHEIGDPVQLTHLDKIYQSQAPKAQVFVQYTSPAYPLPVRLIDCAPVPLRIADPVERAYRQGRASMQLRVRVTDIRTEESIQVRINGVPGAVERVDSEAQAYFPSCKGGGVWFAGTIGAPPLRRGENIVRVLPFTGCWGDGATEIQDVQLVVSYTTA